MRLEHRRPSDPVETLRKARRLVDDETGIVRLLHEAPIDPDAPRIFGFGALYNDHSNIGSPFHSSISGSTSLLRDQAIAGAIGEAVERYSAAFVPHEQLIQSPYSVLEGRAVPPWSLTLYEDAQYDEPEFGYQRIHADRSIGWVAGHSLRRDAPILVPAFAVYQPYRSLCGEAPAIQQITTGLACGNTLEEAILSALCEVVERDAAMLMWLQTRIPPKVRPGASATSVLRALDRFGDLQRYVTVLDVTTDLSIPAYVAVWDAPISGRQGAIFASCANLNPERAVVGSLAELAQCLMWVVSLIDTRPSLPDPQSDECSQIEDHVLWPYSPNARSAYAFALSSEDTVGLDVHTAVGDGDVLASVEACVRLLAARNMDAIVVDVTSPDVRECGFHVVRVLIPGAQPLYVGKQYRRVSARALHGTHPRRAASMLNLHPHPYP